MRQFGLFIHWGLYSLLGGVWQGKQIAGYSEQIRAHARIPRDEYAALAGLFDPVEWDPDAVARLAKEAGMSFVVLTAKHHDGFSLFHTEQSTFNVVDATPFGRDVVAGMADACARHRLEFGVYFSTIDWHFEGGTGIDYTPDASGVRNDNEIPRAHEEFNVAQLRELLTGYGPISQVWFDMGRPTQEQSFRFAKTVRSLQPSCLVSGRVFNHQGDFTVMGDNEIPPYPLEEPWQSPASVYPETWGYRSWQERDDLDAKAREHIGNLAEVVCRGGNYLLNIGPRGDGSVVEFEADLLRKVGSWLDFHSAALVGEPQPFRQLEFGSASLHGDRLSLFITEWPADGVLRLTGLETDIVAATLGDHSLSYQGQEILAGLDPLDGLVPVADVALAGPISVRHAALTPVDGVLNLSEESADTFFRRNGRGYYDPPRLVKLRWWVEVPEDGEYALSVAASDQVGQMQVDGAPVSVARRSRVQLSAGRQIEICAKFDLA